MISILLATYNWPEALALCLDSLRTQTDLDFEIVIADDGSQASTGTIIDAAKNHFPVPITHLWQADMGFRKTKILNQAIQAASGDYLIFLDGDCLVQPDFVARHRQLAEAGHLVTGSRILVNNTLIQQILRWPQWNFAQFKAHSWRYRLSQAINKYWPLHLKLGDGTWRHYRQFVWRRIKGCNMACWRSDALAIEGFDENITGWGHEDADFVFRLQKNRVIRKSGSWSTEVLHLFHHIHDQSNATENARHVRAQMQTKTTLDKTTLNLKPPQRVLFIATRQIGDVLVTTPLIRRARQLWPKAEFHFLGYQGKLDMLKGNTDIQECIETTDHPSFSEYLSLWSRLFQRYDLALVTQPSDRAYFYSLIAARRRVGIVANHPQGQTSQKSKSLKNAWKKWFSLQSVEVDYFRQHVVVEKMRLLEPFISEASLFTSPIALIPPAAEELSPLFLAQIASGLSNNKLAVLHTGPLMAYKRWPLAYWQILVTYLVKKGWQVVLSASSAPQDLELNDALISLLDPVIQAQVIDTKGGLSIPQMGNLLRQAKLYIGVDTSITHLAAACGTTTIALFGPTPPSNFGPWPNGFIGCAPYVLRARSQTVANVTILQGPGECVPCRQAGCDDRADSRSACLDLLEPSEVISAIEATH